MLNTFWVKLARREEEGEMVKENMDIIIRREGGKYFYFEIR